MTPEGAKKVPVSLVVLERQVGKLGPFGSVFERSLWGHRWDISEGGFGRVMEERRQCRRLKGT